ncbi:MAG: multidrug efflux RND transporter periplasmic adaptor subunit VexE [Gammaproteobacteria bacterium]|nr:MAG: multidrug efflux RND transporter periplasmic adaptor subunit VexE [Gammaproteobacteria bacterium]
MKHFVQRNRSVLIALGITTALALWLLSGTGATGSARDPSLEAPRVSRPTITRVRVKVMESQPVTRDVVIYGKTEPARSVTLRAEIDGRVVAIGAKRGTRVQKGDMIVRLDVRDREARRQQARALVEQRKIQYRASLRLESKNFQSEANVAEARANLEAARAALARVEVEIANSVLVAPFDGVLQTRPVEIGDYIAEGKEVARVIELDPILVTGDVTQTELGRLEVGARGTAKLITGEDLEGIVRYVASEADQATRTFRVELEVDNPDRTVVSGTTAQMRIPAETVSAHFISPALLSLNSQDKIGVKSVDDDGTVVFRAVDIVRTGADGVWITGLPERVRVIVVGQGFVREGDRVEAQSDDQGA